MEASQQCCEVYPVYGVEMENQEDREPFSRSQIGKYSYGNGSWRGIRFKCGDINQNLVNIFEN